MPNGLIFDLKHFAIHDGPGIRLTVFFKGCPLRCWWCHNPESMGTNRQFIRRENKIGTRITGWQEEAVGNYTSLDQLMAEIEKDILFFDDSGGGITFSGGEPLLQLEFLNMALVRCKTMEIHTALDTSGFAPYTAFEQIMDSIDLFLYDVKLLDDEDHKTYTGVSNASILNNLKQLSRANKQITIRFPVIPGITDTEKNVTGLISLLTELKNVRHVSLLPYHKTAASKYERFGIKNRLGDVQPPSAQIMESIQSHLQSYDLDVSLGG